MHPNTVHDQMHAYIHNEDFSHSFKCWQIGPKNLKCGEKVYTMTIELPLVVISCDSDVNHAMALSVLGLGDKNLSN